jgi:hypothetical protein
VRITFLKEGGYGLLIWTIAVNILNKQSRTAAKGGPEVSGLGEGANNPSL